MCLFFLLLLVSISSQLQEPLQEWPVGRLDSKEKCLDVVQGEISKEDAEIFRDTKQNVKEEVVLPGKDSAATIRVIKRKGRVTVLSL